jgi:hypothetical protein
MTWGVYILFYIRRTMFIPNALSWYNIKLF